MTYPGGPSDSTQPISHAPASVTTPPHPKTRGKLARRALLAAAGVGVCVAGVELAPVALKKTGEFTQAELHDAFNSGVDAGRRQLLDELSQLEGVTIDGALSAAELTRLAVKYIVLPVSRLVSTVEGGTLDVIYNALQKARDGLSRINVTIDVLNALQAVVGTWRDNVNLLPQRLDQYVNADIDSAEKYLKSLKQKLHDTKAPTLGYTGEPPEQHQG